MRYSDIKLLDDMRFFDGKDVYIYGTGDYGFRAARMLDKIGVFEYTFCNSDRTREGTKKLGNKIIHPSHIPDKASSVAIIAVSPQNRQYIEEMERELSVLSDINTISYFALEQFYAAFDQSGEGNLERMLNQSIAESTERILNMGAVMHEIDSDILVYQPGKVASKSVHKGLVQLGLRAGHIHWLTRWAPPGRHQEYEELLHKALRGKKCITLVREPIARQISAFFESIGNGTAFNKWPVQRSICDFGIQSALGKFMLSTIGHDDLESWFENEFLPTTGIDVFRHPFDVERGYTIIRENGIEVLLMTMESLPSLEGVIGEFIGNNDFRLPKENVGAEKDYARLYQETLDTVEIPRESFDHYYKDNPLMKHFYSQADIECFAARWRGHVKD